MTTCTIRDGLTVSRYCGPGTTAGVHRIRFQIHSEYGYVHGLTISDALDIARALVRLVVDAAYGEGAIDGNRGTD